MPYCPECGHEVGGGDRFCQDCGAELGQTGGAPAGGEGWNESRRTGRGESDSGIDYGQGRRPGSSNSPQSGWGTTEGQSGWDTAEGQSGWDTAGGQSGWDTAEGQSGWDQSGQYDQQRRQPARRGRQQPADDTGLLSFSLTYPGAGGAEQPILGGVAFFFVWLIVPFFLATGYLVRLAAAAAAGRPEPPGFGEWAGMTKDGVVFVVASLPLWLPYTVLSFFAADASGELYLLVVLLGSYLFPAVFVNFAVERRWQSIYEVSTLADLMSSREYVIAFLIYAVVFGLVGSVFLGILLIVTLVTVVGIILWPLIFFYWYAIIAALWGRVYRQVMGPAEIPDPPTRQPRQPRQQPPRQHPPQPPQQQR